MKIKCVWEHNGNDSLLYSANYIGAFTRGETREIALSKMQGEVEAYLRWKNESRQGIAELSARQASKGETGIIGTDKEAFVAEIVQEHPSGLDICDADSDVLFDSEKGPLTTPEYLELKELALKSAEDFLKLYESIPDKYSSVLPEKKTFLGSRPRTAFEMYEHTKSVNSYYFGEIGVDADHEGTIAECRRRGFEALEKQENFLANAVVEGSYDELWSLRKMLRRFIWHDRIHAKAMYRMAKKTFPEVEITDVFRFES